MITDLASAAVFVKKNEKSVTGKSFSERVAIIGAGPCGLSCAYNLALLGYRPTVLEKESKPGGMMVYGIPAFRLKKSIIEEEVEELKQMRVVIETGVEVGKDISLDELRAKGYRAFFIAIGCQGSRALNIPGEELQGVRSSLDFLKEASSGEKMDIKGDVMILGSGDVAVDTARTAVRHAQGRKVVMVYPEQRNEMTAHEAEIRKALSEGVVLQPGWGVQEITGKDGRAEKIICKRCISIFDSGGNFNPRFNSNDLLELECSHVLTAVGENVVWGGLLSGTDVKLGRRQTIVADPDTCRTSQEDVFAGGDVQSGPATVEDAIDAGKRAAVSIHGYLHPEDRTAEEKDGDWKDKGKHPGILHKLFGI